MTSRHSIEQAIDTFILEGWSVEAGYLIKTFGFHSFQSAIDFVNAVAQHAESVNHHPEFRIEYDQVTLRLMSHDVQTLTLRDIDFAQWLRRFTP